MNMRVIRRLVLALAAAAPCALGLLGCSGKDSSSETEAQTAQRQAVIKKHKDAVDNGQ